MKKYINLKNKIGTFHKSLKFIYVQDWLYIVGESKDPEITTSLIGSKKDCRDKNHDDDGSHRHKKIPVKMAVIRMIEFTNLEMNKILMES